MARKLGLLSMKEALRLTVMDESLAVQRFAVVGNQAIDSARLLALVALELGKTLITACAPRR